MKVLILSCNTGEGHNTAGKALVEQFQSRNIECEMLDALLFSSSKTSKAISGLYTNITIKTPSFFGFIYKAALKISTRKFKSIIYYANKPYARRLYGYILDNKIDTVILTHLFPAETITGIKINKDFNFVKNFAVCTDYTCYPFFEDLEPDLLFTPHEMLNSEFTSRGININILSPLGIPVSKKFTQKYDKKKMQYELGLTTEGYLFIIMTGSMGFGNVSDMLEYLLQLCSPADRVVVLGGNNEELKTELKNKFGKDQRFEVQGYTNKVEKYMAACDMLFTKPGGLSSTEAAAIGVPLVHTAPIPGCETYNAKFFSENGLSLYDNNIKSLVIKAYSLVCDKNRSQEMVRKQSEIINKYAAHDICDRIMEYCGYDN